MIMAMENSDNRMAKSTQEQAVAAWEAFSYQRHIEELMECLQQQDNNLDVALNELEELRNFISDPKHILGSTLSKHGEIAEHMQVNISNARDAVEGSTMEYSFDGVGRFAPEDYTKNGMPVQSKFYTNLEKTFFGKHAISDHMSKYPHFLEKGGSYDIPKDQYEELQRLLELYQDPEKRSQLSTAEYYMIKRISAYLEEHDLTLGKDIHPSVVDYSQAQLNAAEATVDSEEKNIQDMDQEKREEAYEDAKPTFKKGMKMAGISAAAEGGMAFLLGIAKKRKEKKFSEFDAEDWKVIGLDTGSGCIKGAVRGSVIYLYTNYTRTPSCVASAYVTAAFGIAGQVMALKNRKITEEEFAINCEVVCLDASISAIGSFLGQTLIPVPVLGALIGNAAAEIAYGCCKKIGTENSAKIIKQYNEDMQTLERELGAQYLVILMAIKERMDEIGNIMQKVLNEDADIAFEGSIQLTKVLGAGEGVLYDMDAITNYFTA